MSKHRRKVRLLLLLALVAAAILWAWRPWQRAIVIRESINPRDGAMMVWVPAGTFRMGSSVGDKLRLTTGHHDWRTTRYILEQYLKGEAGKSDEEPSHTVYLDGYWIYKYEVTVKQYHAFCRATKRSIPPMSSWGWQDDNPITNVS